MNKGKIENRKTGKNTIVWRTKETLNAHETIGDIAKHHFDYMHTTYTEQETQATRHHF